MRPPRYYGILIVNWIILGGLGAIVVLATLPGDSLSGRLAMAAVVFASGLISDRVARALTTPPPDRPSR